MSLWRQLTRGFRALIHRKAADRDIADEVNHYLEQATAAFEASGLSPEEARRAAQLELGSSVAVREQVRGFGWENLIETLLSDLRYGARRLRSRPGFTAIAALTLALGIGASSAIFSALNPVFFAPLPYPDSDRLVAIWDGGNGVRNAVTFGTYRELALRSRSFESMAVMRPLQVTLAGDHEPERLDGQYVSADYFRVLGVTPAIGRDFQESDDTAYTAGSPTVAILSDSLWRRRFAADTSIIGRQITVQNTPVTVVGVLPAGFENVLSPSAEIWSTLRYDKTLPINGREWGHNLRMVGRLHSGRELQQVRQELALIAQKGIAEFSRPQWASLQSGFIANTLQSDLAQTIRPAMLAIVGAAIALLVIACVNVTNLLLARGVGRRAELAVRVAIGASRGRLIRQLLTETLLLAAIGGALGILLAYFAIDVVVALSPVDLPRAASIKVDVATLGFAIALTTLIGLVIGIVPALHRSEFDLHSGMQRDSARITGGYQLTRRTLVVVQVALSAVLLTNGGLLLRSLQSLFAVPRGFDASNVLTMQVQTAFRESSATHQFFTDVLEAVRRVSGVSEAAFTTELPLSGDSETWGVHLDPGLPPVRDADPSAYRYLVTPDYFDAMRIPLKQGRLLDSHDVAGAPFAIVISESFAKRRLPGLNPIGQKLQVGPSTGPWYAVVGVVANVKQTSLEVSQADAVYITEAQWTGFAERARWLVVRTPTEPVLLTTALRQAVWSVDKNQPILRVATMQERVVASEARRRFALLLFEAFGVGALALAAIGTYSLIAGYVTERTREIGIRIAIGATRSRILSLVLRQGLTIAALGVAIGITGATITSRALVTLLFGVSRLDSAAYLGVILLLAAVSIVACGVPAWRAARVRPSVALRSE